jgi:subtilisin family serine protease
MDPLNQIRLSPIMNISSGNPDVKIALIDGPLDYTHIAFHGSKIRSVKESHFAACKSTSSIACRHGTFVAGILSASRASSAPAICPGCTLLIRPVFIEKNQRTNNTGVNNDIFPSTGPNELSDAIIEVVKGGAHIINLSLGLSTSSVTIYPTLQEAYDYARKHEVIIVAASGNQGNIGGTSLIDNQWVIPVAACNENGLLEPTSNIGRSLGLRGLMAPGVNILSTFAGGGYIQMSGTSFAVPFVTGGLALLLSIFPKASAADVVSSIRPSVSTYGQRKSIIPRLLDIESAYNTLKHLI